MLRSIAAVFPVSDVRQTAEWYGRVMGFTVDPIVAERPAFAAIHRDGVEIIFRQDPAALGKHGRANRWNAYIRLDHGELESFFGQVQDKTKVLRPIQKTDAGPVEFEIEDCNGYVLCFAE